MHLRTGQIIPKHNLMDSVTTVNQVTRSWLWSFFCPHNVTTDFSYVDHRMASGWMCDSTVGKCCVECGTVIDVKSTY